MIVPDSPMDPSSRAHERRGATLTRVAVGVLAVSTLLTAAPLAAPEPVAAGSSCTGWTSKIQPPRTIRVLRTSKGRVETVGFRRYVGEVMASGEWPGHFHDTTLEAGAVATKQYAWYYALRGHHRAGYSRNGRCYDVRDDTRDQLYRPERAHPNKRQLRAIERTWNLTLRKNGRFFLTGYRAGTASRCAADANGWKLYSRSVQACARKGWSSQRVQRVYLGPNLSFVWSDRLGPILSRPSIGLRAGAVPANGIVGLTWRRAAGPRVKGYQVQRRSDSRDWKTIARLPAKARSTRLWMDMHGVARFRVRGIGTDGKPGKYVVSRKVRSDVRGPVGRTLHASGAASSAQSRRGTVKLRFRGRSVALMAATGPGMGRVRVLVDGHRVATVNLRRKAGSERRLVWARNFSALKRHSVSVRAVRGSGQVTFKGLVVVR